MQLVFFFFTMEFAEPYQILFQDTATPMMNGIIDLHHYIFAFLIAVLVFVLILLFFILKTFIFKFDSLSLDNEAGGRKKKLYYFLRKDFFFDFFKSYLSYFFWKIVRNNEYEDKPSKKIFKVHKKRKKLLFFVKNFSSNNKNVGYKNTLNYLKKIRSRTFWNSFWTTMLVATVGYSTYTKRYRLQDDFLLNLEYRLVLNWTIPTENAKSTKYNIGLIESTIDNQKSEDNQPSDFNLNIESAFLTALYLKSFNYIKSYPQIIRVDAKQIYGRRYEPKAYRTEFLIPVLSYTDYEYASILNAYITNFMYWIQTYISVKSGISKFTHNTTIEIVWTIIPSVILVFIGIPSFVLLYAMDEIIESDFIIKCIGHQWYWSYEIDCPSIIQSIADKDVKISCNKDNIEEILDYLVQYPINDSANENVDNGDENNDNDNIKIQVKLPQNVLDVYNEFFFKFFADSLENKKQVDNVSSDLLVNTNRHYFNFSSYMINEGDLDLGKLRLLEVDNPIFIPEKTHIDLLITANDVLHSWTIPSFGVKCDAVPGRINHANLFVERTGIFYGQCSEICGVNHGFMPIKIIVENYNKFYQHL
jgi:heme/copper-type cytochrome/quinol oxidase subunit 2